MCNLKCKLLLTVIEIFETNDYTTLINIGFNLEIVTDFVSVVKGLTERFVGSYDDVINALDDGKMNRHVSFTSK